MRQLVLILVLLQSGLYATAGESAFRDLQSLASSQSDNARIGWRADQASVPQPTAVKEPVYTLSQIVVGDQVYFVNAFYDALNFSGKWNPDETTSPEDFQIYTDALVYAVAPTKDRDGFAESIPEIGVWIDRRGHFHSFDVLKEQVAFDRLLLRQPERLCDNGRCVLSFGRTESLTIRPIALTGIMDAATLSIPVYRLDLEYDRLYRQFLGRCAAMGGTDCVNGPWPNPLLDYWHSEFVTARGRIDSLERFMNLLIMRLSPPTAPVRIKYHCLDVPCATSALRYIGSGSYAMAPSLDLKNKLRYSRAVKIEPQGNEPEILIEKSLDPTRDDLWERPGFAQQLRQNQLDAAELLQRLEKEGETMFGGQP